MDYQLLASEGGSDMRTTTPLFLLSAGALHAPLGWPAMSIGTETGRHRRRRVRLTLLRSIPVEFMGERAGEGPLTLGQLNIYVWVSVDPDLPYAILRVELPVPGVVPVEEVAAAAAVLIGRHESLRTTYVPGDPPRRGWGTRPVAVRPHRPRPGQPDRSAPVPSGPVLNSC